jgi:hypothetical protein
LPADSGALPSRYFVANRRTYPQALPAPAKQYLWIFGEIGFLTLVSVILIYLILGPDSSGVFVSGVANNVLKFAAAVPAQSLVGLALVLALVVLLTNRMR